MSDYKVKDCPYCMHAVSEQIVSVPEEMNITADEAWQVVCPYCNARGGCSVNRDNAIMVWNEMCLAVEQYKGRDKNIILNDKKCPCCGSSCALQWEKRFDKQEVRISCCVCGFAAPYGKAEMKTTYEGAYEQFKRIQGALKD